MINLTPITTENGTFRAVRCAVEADTIFYAVAHFKNGRYIDDVATFRVYTNGSAEGFCSELDIFIVADESSVFLELVKALDEILS